MKVSYIHFCVSVHVVVSSYISVSDIDFNVSGHRAMLATHSMHAERSQAFCGGHNIRHDHVFFILSGRLLGYDMTMVRVIVGVMSTIVVLSHLPGHLVGSYGCVFCLALPGHLLGYD